jgi:hypothetical protein
MGYQAIIDKYDIKDEELTELITALGWWWIGQYSNAYIILSKNSPAFRNAFNEMKDYVAEETQ